MSKDPERDNVINILKSIGYHVKEIEESPREKRADLRVLKNGEVYIVEVKSRLENQRLVNKLKTVKPGEIIENIDSLGKSNTLSAIIEEAYEQINATPKDERNFRCIWFRVTAVLGIENAGSKMESTLLGTRDAWVNGREDLIPCYFAGYGDFFRYEDIDGVIIDKGNKAKLIVNPFSPRYNVFEKSSLCILFKEKDAITNPKYEEKEGSAYIVNTKLNRRNDSEIISYLNNKYSIEVKCLINLHSISAITKVPKS